MSVSASSAGWPLAEIKRTEGSHSAKGHPAGDAETPHYRHTLTEPQKLPKRRDFA